MEHLSGVESRKRGEEGTVCCVCVFAYGEVMK